VARSRTVRIETQRSAKERRPINWLANVDKIACILAPADTWLHPYDYFHLTRYPRLRPKGDPIGERTYQKCLAKQIAEFEEHLEARRVLTKLSAYQRKELAALVFDWTCHFIDQAEWKEKTEISNALVRGSKKIERATKSLLNNIQAAVEKIPEAGFESVVEAIKDSHETISGALMTSPDQYQKVADAMKNFPIYEEDLTTLAMVQLYWLFHRSFRLPVGESEERVALIRNSLWSRYAKPVTLAISYSGEESRGCDAVRRAVQRYQPQKGTSPPKTR
jgi:hypothetical protein